MLGERLLQCSSSAARPHSSSSPPSSAGGLSETPGPGCWEGAHAKAAVASAKLPEAAQQAGRGVALADVTNTADGPTSVASATLNPATKNRSAVRLQADAGSPADWGCTPPDLCASLRCPPAPRSIASAALRATRDEIMAAPLQDNAPHMHIISIRRLCSVLEGQTMLTTPAAWRRHRPRSLQIQLLRTVLPTDHSSPVPFAGNCSASTVPRPVSPCSPPTSPSRRLPGQAISAPQSKLPPQLTLSRPLHPPARKVAPRLRPQSTAGALRQF